jgi:hypothetical protein
MNTLLDNNRMAAVVAGGAFMAHRRPAGAARAGAEGDDGVRVTHGRWWATGGVALTVAGWAAGVPGAACAQAPVVDQGRAAQLVGESHHQSGAGAHSRPASRRSARGVPAPHLRAVRVNAGRHLCVRGRAHRAGRRARVTIRSRCAPRRARPRPVHDLGRSCPRSAASRASAWTTWCTCSCPTGSPTGTPPTTPRQVAGHSRPQQGALLPRRRPRRACARSCRTSSSWASPPSG